MIELEQIMCEKFKNKYTIKSARLQNYDYSQNGMYFVTICTRNKEHFFGEIIEGKMILNDLGKIIDQFWQEIPKHFPFVNLDVHQIMPNHLHGIIEICRDEMGAGGNVETQQCCVSTMPPDKIKSETFYQLKPGSLSAIIRSYKSIVAKTTHYQFPNVGFQWQPRFYDHIIRNEESLNKIREYIISNPETWERDKNNSENLFM